jgi:orotate phosphoribosyltransferase
MVKVLEQSGEIDILNLFTESGAILEGHFKLTSGYHSDVYIQCASLLQYPERSGVAADAAFNTLKDSMDLAEIDTVIAPAIGGILWGYVLASRIGCRMIFAERTDNKMTLRRGFSIGRGEKVIVAEDVITTGGSVSEVIKICTSEGADMKAVVGMVDRNSGVDFGYPYYSLVKIDAKKFAPDKCPLCKRGEPLIYPGSRKNNMTD